MYAVVRNYSGPGAGELFNLLNNRKSEVEEIIRGVKGFVGYALIQTKDGGVSVTICKDKAGTDESLKVAREWIQANASNLGTKPPSVTEGKVILHLN